jgi:hypothetical protein
MHPVAIYHFSAQIISRRTGRSSTAAAAYRAGEIVLDENTGEVHDYTRKRGVIRTEIIAPRGSPAWVFDRSQLWSRVELGENRKDSQVCREIEISIPHELTVLQGQLLMIGFVQSQFVSKGMVADVAFHRPGPKGDNRNFHAHVTLTMRKVVGDGFGQKERNWNSNALLQQWREQWAIHANRALEQAGHAARIDHRSHADRGLLDVPGSHHGPAVAGLLARGEQSHVVDRVAEQAAALIARQLADAQAAAERLRRQALEAEMEVQAEMEAEWIQAELAQEAEDQAEREAQFEQLAAEQAAEDAAAAAAAQREAAARAEREKTEREAAERAEAVAAITAAEAVVRQAEQAEQAAAERLDQLRPAKDFAAAGLDRSGHSMLESIKAMPKVSAWQKAVSDFDQAQTVWQKAAAVLATARQVLASAWKRLELLDASVQQARQAQADALKAQAAAQQKGRAMAAKQAQAAQWARGMRGTIQDTRQRIEQERERHQGRERDAPDVPAPRM